MEDFKKVPLAPGLSQRKFQEEAKLRDKVELKPYTIGDVAKHKIKEDLWIVINGKVYDITDYRRYHPGGDKILQGAGSDGTSLFSKQQIMQI